jgi:hypothetical protein
MDLSYCCCFSTKDRSALSDLRNSFGAEQSAILSLSTTLDYSPTNPLAMYQSICACELLLTTGIIEQWHDEDTEVLDCAYL